MTTTNTNTGFAPIEVAVVPNENIVRRYPTTDVQLEIWLSSTQSKEASCAYNEISTLEISGALDTAKLHVAVEKLVERHESLRSFISADGSQIEVRKVPAFEFKLFDWTGDSDSTVRATRREVIREFAETPFDLQRGPLLRIAVQQLANEKFNVTIVAHHIVIDGWSLGVFVRDLGAVYDSLVNGNPLELAAAPTYVDYAERMEEYSASEQGRVDEAYWLNQFQDDIPVLDLPATHPRPHLRTYRSQRHDHWLTADLVAKLRSLAAKQGCSLFGAVFTAFQGYIARLTNNTDFCIGIPTAGQPAMDMTELLGHCVNTLPLRSQVDLAASYKQRLAVTRTEMLDSFDHQRYSYGALLRKLAPPRDPSRPPMLSVSLNVDPEMDTTQMGFSGMDVSIVVEPRAYENFEWFVNGVIHGDGSIELQVQFNADLFSREAIKFYFEGFQAFIAQIVERPDASLAEHSLMTIEQREQVVCKWNETQADFHTSETLHEEFRKTASTYPDHVAVRFGDQSLTYAEVDSYTNQLAQHLADQGVESGDLIGLCIDRSAEMFTGVMAILKAGAGYVPLDPSYPADRLHYMCETANVKLVLTQDRHLELLKNFGKRCLSVDSSAEAIAASESTSFDNQSNGDDTAYVIFTSGSTGQPKGVQVAHRTVLNLLHSMNHEPGLESHESILAVTSLSFDMSVSEIFLPLTCGACLAIVDKETTIDGEKLAAAIEKYDAKLIQATPATWRLLVQSDWSGKKDLRIVSAGEPFPSDLVEPLLNRTAEVWNMYGPTETTVYSTAKRIMNADDPIVIGHPVANTQIYLLDSAGHEVPPGVEGEMFIGGAGVTQGYLNREDLTADRFVDNPWFNPFADYGNWRLYKTGDVAKHTFDGEIEYLRRNDKQVKIRGFRIELGEIERSIRTFDQGIQQAVVIVRDDSHGNPTLVAYWIGSQECQFSDTQLRDHLRGALPHYMVPKHFVRLEQMPMTSNGKVNHKALPAPNAPVQTTGDSIGPATASEKFLSEVWKEILEVDSVSLDDNFFELGGHSLLVMQVITRVQQECDVRLSPQDFLTGTLEILASQLNDSDAEAPAESTVKVTAESDEPSEPQQTSASTDTAAPETPVSNRSGFAKLRGFWN